MATTTAKSISKAPIKRAEESKSCSFILEGTQSLGSCLKFHVNAPDSAIDRSNCSIQWSRAAWYLVMPICFTI